MSNVNKSLAVIDAIGIVSKTVPFIEEFRHLNKVFDKHISVQRHLFDTLYLEKICQSLKSDEKGNEGGEIRAAAEAFLKKNASRFHKVIYSGHIDTDVFEDFLPCFTRVEALIVRGFTINSIGFIFILKSLPTLTSLVLDDLEFGSEIPKPEHLVDASFVVSNLKMLTLSQVNFGTYQDISSIFSTFKGLKSLNVSSFKYFPKTKISYRSITNLSYNNMEFSFYISAIKLFPIMQNLNYLTIIAKSMDKKVLNSILMIRLTSLVLDTYISEYVLEGYAQENNGLTSSGNSNSTKKDASKNSSANTPLQYLKVSEKVSLEYIDYIFSFKKGSLQKIDSELSNLARYKELNILAKVQTIKVYSTVPDKILIHKLFKVPNLKQISYDYNIMNYSEPSIPKGFEGNWKITCDGEATGYKRTDYVKTS